MGAWSRTRERTQLGRHGFRRRRAAARRRALATRCASTRRSVGVLPARQPNRDPFEDDLQFNGRSFAFSDFRFTTEVDEARVALDVSLWHPLFASTPIEARQHIQFLVLDQLLGEDDVIRWIGAIETLEAQPANAIDAVQLRREVASFAAGKKGTARLVQGKRGGQPFATVLWNGPKWVDHPFLDYRVTITFPLHETDDEGLPTSSEMRRVLEQQGELVQGLNGRAITTLVRVMDGRAMLRLYVDHDDQAALDAIREVASTWQASEFDTTSDPGWELAEYL